MNVDLTANVEYVIMIKQEFVVLKEQKLEIGNITEKHNGNKK